MQYPKGPVSNSMGINIDAGLSELLHLEKEDFMIKCHLKIYIPICP
jgi:hypothetical protein